MATIGVTIPNWLDVASRMDPKLGIDAIVEIMNDMSPFISDGAVYEGNLTTGHKSTQRTGLPSATWRLINQGVLQSKSQTQQVTDSCGMLEAYAEVDKKLVELNSNSSAFMASEDISFLESMTQTMEQTTIDGDTSVNPERFMGLQPRYSYVAGTDRRVSDWNVINHGGTGNRTSIWAITWGPRSCFYIYPKGSKAGFMREFLGQKTIQSYDSNGDLTGQYEGYRTHYSWDIGMALVDWRTCGRIANINVQDITDGGGLQVEESLIRLLNRLRKTTGRTVLYCSEEMMTVLDIRAQAKTNVWLGHGEWAGKEVVTFRGVPIRVCDRMVNAEGAVAARPAT